MELIVISNAVFIDNEPQIINDLFAAGMKRFHLRKPDATEKQVRTVLDAIDSKYHHRIALHQHHSLTNRYPIRRLHYSEQSRLSSEQEILVSKKEQGYELSTSVHSTASLAEVRSFGQVFFGPVFNSISKPGYEALRGEYVPLPLRPPGMLLVGLGGVDAGNLHELKHMGFDGAAVLGTIWQRPVYAVETFLTLKNIVNNL